MSNKWQPISTYPLPENDWDYSHPQALFFSESTGIVIGQCIKSSECDSNYPEYFFQFDRDGLKIEPTHWMPLPLLPARK
jgi:hypothetical protein